MDSIVGFIDFTATVDIGVIDKLQWLDDKFRSLFENGNKMYLEKIVVKNGFQRKHVGSFLFNSLRRNDIFCSKRYASVGSF